MPVWLISVVASEFVWGVVLGIALSVLAAWFGVWFQNREQKRRVKVFSSDLVTNLRDYAKSLDEHRERSNIIYEDYLALIETEIGLWGRNREHMIMIDDDALRRSIRDYLAKVAKSVVEVRFYLNRFNDAYRRTQETKGTGAAVVHEREAAENLQLARDKADKLTSHINSGFSSNDLAKLARPR